MGGHKSAIFPGTAGDRNSKTAAAPISTPDTNSERPHTEQTYSPTPELRKHITEATKKRDQISGGHEKHAFEAMIDKLGAKIENRIPSSRVDGVEKVIYRMPRLDREGKPTGEYKNSTKEKTIYDPSKISTNVYMHRGFEAVNDAANGRLLSGWWEGRDSQGVKWVGRANIDGSISTLYPDE